MKRKFGKMANIKNGRYLGNSSLKNEIGISIRREIGERGMNQGGLRFFWLLSKTKCDFKVATLECCD